MGKLFGTDGIRGIVNQNLNGHMAYQVGLAAAQVLSDGAERPRVYIARDTRISGHMLEAALTAGLTAAGADVLCLGVLPTPAVAYLTKENGFHAGIMVSASHNPFEHNGIKIFNASGFKLSDELEEAIENLVLGITAYAPLPTGAALGRVLESSGAERAEYIAHLQASVQTELANQRILIDCANGAASATAQALFAAFPKLQCDIIFDRPDGMNINTDCGSTHLNVLSARVVEGGYDLGIAFDGDADRCLCVDENGQEIDGDKMMAVCAAYLREQGKLHDDTIVATVMSNIGLHRYCKEQGLELLCTPVGDRNVLERMLADGYSIGGEQSGHMIFIDYATTGDGQLSALQFLQVLQMSGQSASQLVSVCLKYPQVLINVHIPSVEDKERILSGDALAQRVQAAEAQLGGEGRVLIRPSGTEALIRVMVEAQTQQQASALAEELAAFIEIA